MRRLVEKDFRSKDTPLLARNLLGKVLALKLEDGAQRYAITEVEAYDGPRDLACHASRGRTKRTEPMLGPAAAWYVYLCYGVHEMINLTTGPIGYPAAILIRGLDGVIGPGRLTKRLGIDRRFNGLVASRETGLWLEDSGIPVADKEVEQTARIGVDYAGPDWANRPYRYIWCNA
ncbi:MAG: DNA-3-methyladenine glycosylase [Verrucomicrobiota bacterium]|nr:DNA-3-methyladenine glycosylase [Verrucomicrobiota bacterium]